MEKSIKNRSHHSLPFIIHAGYLLRSATGFSPEQTISQRSTAIEYEKEAIAAWKQLVEAAGDFYSKTLNFSVEGNFSDPLVFYSMSTLNL